MVVKDKIMYHINNSKNRSDIWVPGKVIDNTEDYISDFWTYGLNFSSKVHTVENNDVAFYKVINHYLEETQDEETYIRMLKQASIFLREYSIVQREYLLEVVRIEKYPNLPSRKNCIYLCDKKQLEFWKKELEVKKNNLGIFEVSATGNLFKSSDKLLPDDGDSINNIIDQANAYWNPNLNDIDDEKAEYLFKGKLLILKKL